MNSVTSVPGMADPLLATIRRLEVSYLARTFSGRLRMRCSMIGTAIRAVTRCWSIACRQRSGSNRSCRTTVARSGVLICNAPSPQVWKIGAEISMVSSARSGSTDSMAATLIQPGGVARLAPFGVPVVPEVSTMSSPSRSGVRSVPRGALSTRSSSVALPATPLGAMALMRVTVGGRYCTSGSNSSSVISTRMS